MGDLGVFAKALISFCKKLRAIVGTVILWLTRVNSFTPLSLEKKFSGKNENDLI